MSPLLFAEFTPLSPAAQLAIVSLLAVGATVTAIWANLRRKPSIDVDLVQLASSIKALQSAVESLTRHAEKHASHDSLISQLQTEVATLRGAQEASERVQRSHIAKLTRELYDRIEASEKSSAVNFQSIERALGRIEGLISARTAPSGG